MLVKQKEKERERKKKQKRKRKKKKTKTKTKTKTKNKTIYEPPSADTRRCVYMVGATAFGLAPPSNAYVCTLGSG